MNYTLHTGDALGERWVAAAAQSARVPWPLSVAAAIQGRRQKVQIGPIDVNRDRPPQSGKKKHRRVFPPQRAARCTRHNSGSSNVGAHRPPSLL